MNREELLDKAMNATWEEIEKLTPGSKERKFMEETFCKLVELEEIGRKNDYDSYYQNLKIETDERIKLEEIRMKMEQWKSDRKRSWLPSADAILITTIFSLMTLILYVIEGKGIIAPKAAKTLEKLLRFVRIG